MSLDVNKLIMESVEATLADDPEYQAQKQAQNNPQPQRREQSMQENNYDPLATITASAISAGLGALAMTNRIRNLQEGVSEHLKNNWKYAGGAAGLAAAGAAAYDLAKGEGSGLRKAGKYISDKAEEYSPKVKAKYAEGKEEGGKLLAKAKSKYEDLSGETAKNRAEAAEKIGKLQKAYNKPHGG